MRIESDIVFIDSHSDVLSRHCPAAFKLHGTSYLSAWHYVVYQKAVVCRDMVAAHRIKLITDSHALPELEKSIQHADEGNWLRQARRFMDDANLAKFDQHAAMREVLLNTSSQIILSVTTPGSIWCAALPGSGPNLPESSSWESLNLEGLSLVQTRKTLLTRLIPRRGWHWDATPEPVPLSRKIDICFSWTQGYCQIRPRESWMSDLKATAPALLLTELEQYMKVTRLDVDSEDPERIQFLAWLEDELDLGSLVAPTLHAAIQRACTT